MRGGGSPLEALADMLRAAGHDGTAPSGLRPFAAVRDLLVALASERPLVLVLDDLHQADRSSWDLVACLARNAPRTPVLVVASSRVAPLVEDAVLSAAVGVLGKDGMAQEIRLAHGAMLREALAAKKGL